MARKIPSQARSRCWRKRAACELLKQGWKPKRTIIYCAWDGEEPMLLGSTEWAEYHGDELKQHAAIYINTDGNGRGYLAVGGSHSLEKFVNGVARDVEDPRRISPSGSATSRGHRRREDAGRPERCSRSRRPAIDALGSGSD